jgi:hypothetical protein
MRQRLGPMLAICALLALTTEANAADPNQLIGKWIEHLPNGSGLITEFTATTISSYPIDKSGKAIGSPLPMKVAYKDLGDSIGVDFADGGRGVMVLVKDPNDIVLDFPGLGAHQLTRTSPAP